MEIRPERHEDLLWREIDGETFILSDNGRKIITLNKVASFIWQQCDGSCSVGHILDLIMEHFDVEKTRAEQDLTTLINEMYKEEVIGFK